MIGTGQRSAAPAIKFLVFHHSRFAAKLQGEKRCGVGRAVIY